MMRTVLMLTFATLVGLSPCNGPSVAAELAPLTTLEIDVDNARLITLPAPATNVFVANPAVADIQVPNATNVIAYGKRAGTTTIYALNDKTRIASYTVVVRRAVGTIAAALEREVPGARVDVRSTPNGIIVSGSTAAPADAAKLRAVARQYLGDKEDLTFDVAVQSATQVNLQVRVAEVTRQAEKNFGFNWSALFNNGTVAVGLLTGRAPVSAFGSFIASPNNFDSIGAGYRSKSVNISALIDALQSDGLISVLAEPNLTAISGETANFLAGGEFPVPVSQGLQQITIEWKKFGVSVDFTPTVLDPNRLSIKVRPEVSELTDAGAVVIDSIKIPGLAVRRAETTVELASGQSFAIAGLFQNNAATNIDRLPWLGDVPVLGALFRSDHFKRNESELVIIVTPYIVRPATRSADLQLPTDGLAFASDLERSLLGKLTSTPQQPAPEAMPRLSGPAGFVWE